MKVFPFKIPKPAYGSLIYQEDHEYIFYDKLHQHEEIQISYIVKGEGTMIVGDGINHYKAKDVLVIGSNIPHVFKSDKAALEKSKMISLFFTVSSFGKDFFELDDLSEISGFFDKSKYGIKLANCDTSLKNLFLSLKKASKLERFLLFIKIIKGITHAETTFLSSFANPKQLSVNEGHRLRTIFEYTIHHAHTNISLNHISAMANMSKNAFCRYFKTRTNKTYFQFLIEVRVENACRLLAKDNELSILEISEIVGFNNISNFNRKFRKIKNTTPSNYRKSELPAQFRA